MGAGEGTVEQSEIMRRLEKIEQRQIRAEERTDAHSVRVGDLLEQVVAALNGLTASVQAQSRSSIESQALAKAQAATTPPPPRNQNDLIRWLAFAVVAASLGTKALELLFALWVKG